MDYSEYNRDEFFIGDKFYSSLEDLLLELVIDYASYNDLPDDFELIATGYTIEPIVNLSLDQIAELIADSVEHRYSEDGMDGEYYRVIQCVKESFDLNKVKCCCPHLYYPSKDKIIINKGHLIDIDSYS